jgi:UDP-glucose 4-epimerase
MGMSKAIAEKVMIAKARQIGENDTTLCGTRYGNVMASRGSVIPLFINQIKNHQAITITDPNMTRFMMTLDDAVDLVLYAFNNGMPGDIFVQKAPAATIGDLAIVLKEIYNADNEIKIIGVRHGEKIYETLINREEMSKALDLDSYYRIPADNRNLNYNKFFIEGEIKVTQLDDYTSNNTKRLNRDELKQLLFKLPIIRKDILGEDTNNIYEP